MASRLVKRANSSARGGGAGSPDGGVAQAPRSRASAVKASNRRLEIICMLDNALLPGSVRLGNLTYSGSQGGATGSVAQKS